MNWLLENPDMMVSYVRQLERDNERLRSLLRTELKWAQERVLVLEAELELLALDAELDK